VVWLSPWRAPPINSVGAGQAQSHIPYEFASE